MEMTLSDIHIHRSASDRRAEALLPGLNGAVAALETFYCGFNTARLDLLMSAWTHHPTAQLCNPVGGFVRGPAEIERIYRLLVNGPARLWVEYHDISYYSAEGLVVFAGRERGGCEANGEILALSIRATRVFSYFSTVGWKQVHHHGSIDDPNTLEHYQSLMQRK